MFIPSVNLVLLNSIVLTFWSNFVGSFSIVVRPIGVPSGKYCVLGLLRTYDENSLVVIVCIFARIINSKIQKFESHT